MIRIERYWAWEPWTQAKMILDQPTLTYPLLARDQQLVRLASEAGISKVLTGYGPDHYLVTDLTYIASLLASGQVARGLKEIYDWALLRRRSLASQLLLYGVSPLLWRRVPIFRRRLGERRPRWLLKRSHAFGEARPIIIGTRPESLWRALIEQQLAAVPGDLLNWRSFEEAGGLELGHPFLNRDLVEFSLRLPVDLIMRPPYTKYLLREAMKDIVPERVRVRVRKGGTAGLWAWSLQREWQRVSTLSNGACLAEAGIVEPAGFHDDVERAMKTGRAVDPFLLRALACETWLADMKERAGRGTM